MFLITQKDNHSNTTYPKTFQTIHSVFTNQFRKQLHENQSGVHTYCTFNYPCNTKNTSVLATIGDKGSHRFSIGDVREYLSFSLPGVQTSLCEHFLGAKFQNT